MESRPRAPPKFFQRFPALRRRRPRHARSEDGLAAGAVTTAEKEANVLYPLQLVGRPFHSLPCSIIDGAICYQVSSNTTDASVAQQGRKDPPRYRPPPLASAARAIDHCVSQESLVDPALSPRSMVPSYTPLPIPERDSSAKSDAFASKCATALLSEKHDSHQDTIGDADSAQDDLSLDFSCFDDNLLEPEPQATHMQMIDSPHFSRPRCGIALFSYHVCCEHYCDNTKANLV